MIKKDKELQRNLSQIGVWALALGSIIGWGAFVMPGNLFLPTAGPIGTTIAMAIGAIIMLIIAKSYGYMINKFPVAGGEFAFAKNTFNTTHGFICGWFVSLAYFAIVPLNATALGLIGKYLFPGVLQRGYLYTVAGWEVYLGEIILASLALIFFAVISIRGVKIAGWIQTFLSVSLVISILILTIVAILSKDTSFNNLKPYFGSGTNMWEGIIRIVAIAPWAYVGFDAIPQAAEEFNFSPKKVNSIMFLAIIVGGILYILMNLVTAIVMPWNELLSLNSTWATGFAIEKLAGVFGMLLLGIALISAICAGILGFYMASNRLLYSMAKEGVLPSRFAYLHKDYGTPVYSILFVMFLSLIIPWLGREVLLWVVDMSSIGVAIGFGYTCLSAFVLGRKEVKKSERLNVISLMGLLFSVSFVGLLIIPGMPSYLSIQARIMLVIWILLGLIFYRSKLKVKKIN